MGAFPSAALSIKPPESPLEAYAKVQNVKNLQQQNQLGQVQVQEAQQDLQDQQKFRQAFMQANGDPDKTVQLAAQSGVGPKLLVPFQQNIIAHKTALMNLTKDQQALAEHTSDLLQGAHTAVDSAPDDQKPIKYQQQLDGLKQAGVDVSQFPPQYPGNDQFKLMGVGIRSLSKLQDDAFKQSETAKDTAQARSANAEATMKEIEAKGLQGMTPEYISSAVDRVYDPNSPATGGQNRMVKGAAIAALNRGDLQGTKQILQDGFSKALQTQADIQRETDPAVQAGKIKVATAEGRARQAVEGMAKPVYAMAPDGTKTLMSQTDALQKGFKTVLPVNEKQVGDDVMLINRLGDVRQKIARYEQAINADISAKDQGNIAALIGKQSFKIGAFGTELPLDRLNAAVDKENISGLSDQAKKLLVSYYNARESMVGYQRVLSGSGRSSEKSMELQLDALPNPGTADKSFANEALKQFKENLGIVGQGLPRIPGVKSPEEIEQSVSASPQQSAPAPAAPKQGKASKWGQTF